MPDSVSSHPPQHSFFFFFLLLQSVFQLPDTEQTGNGMGTSARLAFPRDSEAGRIQAILQMQSWEIPPQHSNRCVVISHSCWALDFPSG